MVLTKGASVSLLAHILDDTSPDTALRFLRLVSSDYIGYSVRLPLIPKRTSAVFVLSE